MNVKKLEDYDNKYCKTNMISSIIFGRLFLAKRQFFAKYFNLLTFSILFFLFACFLFCPIAKYFPVIFCNLVFFSIYSSILFFIIYFIFNIAQMFFPKLATIDFRELKNPYIYLSVFLILFNYFYFVAYRNGDELGLFSYYLYYNFFTFMNMITMIFFVFLQILFYFVVIFVLNFSINKIFPSIPMFSGRILFFLNLFLFVISYIIKFLKTYYPVFKMDVLNLNKGSIKFLLILIITNVLAILAFTTCEISFKLYNFFRKKLIERNTRNLAVNELVQDNRILYSLVYNSKIIRVLLITLIILIVIKFIIVCCF